jgi:hypothetical protein
MSVVQNTLIGRARQKIGGSVFSSWKGINVLKSKPLTVANPKTPGQIQQRSVISQTTAIFRAISGPVNLGFKQQAVQMSEFNAFAKYNTKNAFNKATAGVATLVPASVLVSQGTITSTPILMVLGAAGTREVTATWDSTTLQPGQSNADLAVLVLHNNTQKTWTFSTASVVRTADEIDLTVPVGFMAHLDVIQAYLFFYNKSTRKSSDSITETFTAAA